MMGVSVRITVFPPTARACEEAVYLAKKPKRVECGMEGDLNLVDVACGVVDAGADIIRTLAAPATL
jgi:hypothetical protein